MNRIKNAVMGILPFAVLGGLLWLSYKSVVFIYHVFTSLNPNVVVAIIAGVATVLASTLAVVVTRYFQAKADKEALTVIERLTCMMRLFPSSIQSSSVTQKKRRIPSS
jgi:hypothetical protein